MGYQSFSAKKTPFCYILNLDDREMWHTSIEHLKMCRYFSSQIPRNLFPATELVTEELKDSILKNLPKVFMHRIVFEFLGYKMTPKDAALFDIPVACRLAYENKIWWENLSNELFVISIVSFILLLLDSIANF